jgi:hypothetical protein
LTLGTTGIGVFDWLLASNLRLNGCMEVGRALYSSESRITKSLYCNIDTRPPTLMVDPLIISGAHKQVLSLSLSPIHNDQTSMREELISIGSDNSNQKIVHVLTFPSPNPYIQWRPPIELPYNRSDHPIDTSCLGDGLQSLLKFSSMPPSWTIAYLSTSTSDNLTVNDLQNLLTHDSPINQQVINLYLQVLGNQFSIKCLETAFFPTLQREGWPAVT